MGTICEKKETDRRSFALASSSDRNFRRAFRVRRNGVSVIGSVRGRMPSEKKRLLEREENAEEHNAANVREVLRSLSQSYRDNLFLVIGAEARSCLVAWFPWLSSKARSQVVRRIHEEGQLRRKKANESYA